MLLFSIYIRKVCILSAVERSCNIVLNIKINLPNEKNSVPSRGIKNRIIGNLVEQNVFGAKNI